MYKSTYKMKRILFVTRDLSYIGGTEEFIKNILLFIKNNKFDLFLFEIEGHGKFSNKQIYKAIGKKVKIFSFDKEIEELCSINKIKALINIIEKYKIDIVHSFLFNADFITCTAKIGSEAFWSEISKIKSFEKLCKIMPSINKLKNALIKPTRFQWFSSKTNDVSVESEIIYSNWSERKRIINEEIEPIVSKYCDFVLPVYKNGVRKWSKFSKKVRLLPCASITTQDFKRLKNRSFKREILRKKYGLDSKDRLFVSVARLVPKKGLDKLIKIFANENNNTKNILFIAGCGPLEKKLKLMSAKAKNIKFLGCMSRNKIFDLLVACDIFVLLSRSEGFPLAIQEAMAAGKPIWATKVGGIPDLVSRSNGILSVRGDINSLKRDFKLVKKQKKEELERMGENSRTKIIRLYMVEKVVKKLKKLYLIT
jgi:glycosyltransferase involved in cell wall biosynthesis